MEFVYRTWETFCQALSQQAIYSIPAKELVNSKTSELFLVLKHDVETNVASAYRIAEIEHRYGHCGSYYVQAYLLEDAANTDLLKKMQAMGHEISYHYDVMDSCSGDIPNALSEFEKNKKLFESEGFPLDTVCQHGNPVVERKGYTSNRDFFRNPVVQAEYPHLTDIMVDFPEKSHTEYLYFSDAGRRFQRIFDPFYNDIIPSDEKNIPFDTLNDLLSYVQIQEANCIISMHPHRWVSSVWKYRMKTTLFKCIRAAAKTMMKVPILKKIMSRYYYLAKKI